MSLRCSKGIEISLFGGPYEKQTIKFTISIGISSALDTDTDSTDVLSRAREALHQAKKKGKNRIGIN